MLRASSETAVAMRLWSTVPKPSCRAVSRARWRDGDDVVFAADRDSSRLIAAMRTALSTVVPRARRAGCSSARPFSALSAVRTPLQLQPQLDQRDRDRRLNADHHRLGAQQPRADGDIVQQPAEERVDRLHHGEVEQHAARAGALQLAGSSS